MQLLGMGDTIRIVTRVDRMVFVKGTGLVTRSGLVSALDLAWANRDREVDYYAGMLVDLREATYINGEPHERNPPYPGVLQEMPAAVVVADHQIRRFMACAMVCATEGIVLGVFTEIEPAQAWVTGRARALRAQRAMLQRKSLAMPQRMPCAGSQDRQSDQGSGQDPEQGGQTSP